MSKDFEIEKIKIFNENLNQIQNLKIMFKKLFNSNKHMQDSDYEASPTIFYVLFF